MNVRVQRRGRGKTGAAGMYTLTPRQGRIARRARRMLRKAKHRIPEGTS